MNIEQDTCAKPLIIGIDASNLLRGGGQTHLRELIANASPARHGFERLVVWGGPEVISSLPNLPWLEKLSPSALNRSSLRRALWQTWTLSREAKRAKCDVLLVPGGVYSGAFHPSITMCRNMLPFELREIRRYGVSRSTMRLLALHFVQRWSFSRADGIIFLSKYSKAKIERIRSKNYKNARLIPHGINDRFLAMPREARDVLGLDVQNPFRILYVSIVSVYKHQWNVIEAVAALRSRTCWPLELYLVGSIEENCANLLHNAIMKCDPTGCWVKVLGNVPYETLHTLYARADLGVFASSCETLPNVLLENMAAGLPIACSSFGPMPEVLQDAGVYFDPESVDSISLALSQYIASPALRRRAAERAFEIAETYSWPTTVDETMRFVHDVKANLKGSKCAE